MILSTTNILYTNLRFLGLTHFFERVNKFITPWSFLLSGPLTGACDKYQILLKTLALNINQFTWNLERNKKLDPNLSWKAWLQREE